MATGITLSGTIGYQAPSAFVDDVNTGLGIDGGGLTSPIFPVTQATSDEPLQLK